VIERIDSRNIIRIITQALLIASLIGESLSFKFIFFGVDNVSVFEGAQIGIM